MFGFTFVNGNFYFFKIIRLRHFLWLVAAFIARYCQFIILHFGEFRFFQLSSAKFILRKGVLLEINGFRLTSSLFDHEMMYVLLFLWMFCRRPIGIVVDRIKITCTLAEFELLNKELKAPVELERCLKKTHFWKHLLLKVVLF